MQRSGDAVSSHRPRHFVEPINGTLPEIVSAQILPDVILLRFIDAGGMEAQPAQHASRAYATMAAPAVE